MLGEESPAGKANDNLGPELSSEHALLRPPGRERAPMWARVARWSFALAVVLLFLVPVARASAQTVVSIEFDDGNVDQYAARSILSSHGMHGTYFVNTGVIGTNSNWLSWSQVSDLSGDGNEIADHGVQHLALATASSTEQAREICGDRTNLFAHGYQPTD